jgi:hypothetical protein
MKGKTRLKTNAALAMLLLTIAACAVFLPRESLGADTLQPVMYITPSPTLIKGAEGSTFNLMLMIQNFSTLYIWQAGLQWNPAVLSMTSEALGDTELPNNVFHTLEEPGWESTVIPGSIDNTAGKLGIASQSFMGNVTGVNATGTLADGYVCMKLTFMFVGVGSTAVSITNVKLLSGANTTSYGTYPKPMKPVDTINGSVTTAFGPVMYITPSYLDGTQMVPGHTFSLMVQIQNFSAMYTWQTNIQWNPLVLNVTGVAVGDSELPTNVFHVLDPSVPNSVLPAPPLYPTYVNNKVGTLTSYVAQSLSGIVPGVNGTGTLATGYNMMNFTFKVVGYGNSSIGIIPKVSYYICANGTKVIPQFINGTVATYTPKPHGPTASFTATPMLQQTGLPVAFDASSSTPGYNGKVTCPITTYSWNFGDGNITNTTGPTITHTYINTTITSKTPITSTTNFTVTLTVYAPGATPVSNSTSLVVRIYPPAIGASLDLTSNADASLPAAMRINGTGPGAWSDMFAPQELMILYAKVAYNKAPVTEKLVSFYVEYPNGTIWIQGRVNETGTNGTAEVEFRIPNSPKFGDYIAYATVEVAGKIAADYMPFYIGWRVVVTSVGAASSYALGADMVFNATVTNHAFTPQNVTLTFVVYDAVGVPIGCYTLNVTLPAASIPVSPPTIPSVTKMFSSISMILPSSAFVGSPPPLPAVFVDSFTAPPWLGGVPTGPEASATFGITK